MRSVCHLNTINQIESINIWRSREKERQWEREWERENGREKSQFCYVSNEYTHIESIRDGVAVAIAHLHSLMMWEILNVICSFIIKIHEFSFASTLIINNMWYCRFYSNSYVLKIILIRHRCAAQCSWLCYVYHFLLCNLNAQLDTKYWLINSKASSKHCKKHTHTKKVTLHWWLLWVLDAKMRKKLE